jgi:predicted Fe-S protein YdhL (DUF1289 family)
LAVNNERRVFTPCIGVCSTGIGDEVCRGCKRYAHEVIHWNGYNHEEKRAIEARLDALLVQVVSAKLRIVEASVLEWQMQVQKLRYQQYRDPYVWLFALLKAGAGQIEDPLQFGFARRKPFARVPLMELKEAIDSEFYILSQAHYERYLKHSAVSQ